MEWVWCQHTYYNPSTWEAETRVSEGQDHVPQQQASPKFLKPSQREKDQLSKWVQRTIPFPFEESKNVHLFLHAVKSV